MVSGKTFQKRLAYTYGIIFLVLLGVFGIINFITEEQLRDKGIDQLIKNHIESVFINVRILSHQSVKNYIKLENEKLVNLISLYFRQVQEGIISQEEAQKIVIEKISNASVGDTGYSYIVDSHGVMVSHPVEKYINQDFSWDPAIQKQIVTKEGYIEYQWQNPDDKTKREKILYMSYFEPWGWILSTTAYDDDKAISNIQTSDVEFLFDSISLEGITSFIILNGKGIPLLYEWDDKEDSTSMDDIKEMGFPGKDEMIKDGQGQFFVRSSHVFKRWKSERIFYFQYIEDLDWLLIVGGYTSRIYQTINEIYLMTWSISLFIFCLSLYINSRLSKGLTQPVYDLVNIIDKNMRGEMGLRANIDTGDELELLGNQYNEFLDRQKQYIEEIESSRNEIEILARFPNENPNPVLRIRPDRFIEYANKAGVEQVLKPFGLNVKDYLDESLFLRLTSATTITGKNEIVIGDFYYSFSTSVISSSSSLYLYGRDITQQKKFESNKLLSDNIFRNSIEGMLITDSSGIILSVNPSFTQITGYSSEDAIGKTPRILKSFKQDSAFYKKMWKQLEENGFWSGEIWNRRKNGEIYPEYLNISSLRNDKNEISEYISFFHDLSDIKKREAKIEYEKYHDELTSLPNRKCLSDYLQSLVTDQVDAVKGITFYYFNIKQFKYINESNGYETGDLILQQVARRLSDLAGEEARVFRAGSDNFLIVYPNLIERDQVVDFVSQINRFISHPFFIRGSEIVIKAAIGISQFPMDGDDLSEVVPKAEIAMNSVKSDLISDFSFFSAAMKEDTVFRFELENAVRKAAEEKLFFLQYQPKVDTESQKIIGAEALIRMKPVDGKYIGPDRFIPIAEEIGLIESIGAWVLEKAAEDTRFLIDSGYSDLNIAVNLSSRQFADSELSRQIKNILDSYHVTPRNLSLELTESMAVQNAKASIMQMNKLAGVGLSLAVDDFGTGYSSLSYLVDFPINILKIDKAFVNEIPENRKKTGVVLGILALADQLGLKTVAEGVENEEQYNFLKQHNCDYIQGYYFFRPLVLSDFLEELRKQKNLL